MSVRQGLQRQRETNLAMYRLFFMIVLLQQTTITTEAFIPTFATCPRRRKRGLSFHTKPTAALHSTISKNDRGTTGAEEVLGFAPKTKSKIPKAENGATTTTTPITNGKHASPQSTEESNTQQTTPSQPPPSTTTTNDLSAQECKTQLLHLLPRMTGQESELRTIETLINTLEAKYQPVLTLDFFNMAMEGEWQLLFSTNYLRVPPKGLRLRRLAQVVSPDGKKGGLVNVVAWDLADGQWEQKKGEEDAEEDDEYDASGGMGMPTPTPPAQLNFDCTGTFSVKCTYELNHGARMHTSMEELLLKPIGKTIPSDPQKLVGMLYRAMPKELFDPNGADMDTTYLDADLRIVRLSGERFEGVRNVFVRDGAVEIDPRAGGS